MASIKLKNRDKYAHGLLAICVMVGVYGIISCMTAIARYEGESLSAIRGVWGGILVLMSLLAASLLAFRAISKSKERLQEEKEAIDEENEHLTEFLTHLSHQIRTPLTAISGIGEILLDKQDNMDARQKQLVQTLHSSTMTLKAIMNDIPDFAGRRRQRNGKHLSKNKTAV